MKPNDRKKLTWLTGAVAWIMLAGVGVGAAQGEPKPEVSTDGVSAIASPGIPGVISVWGESAAAVVTGKSEGVRLPVVAATAWGKGRIVAFAHDGYFDARNLGAGDTRQLFRQVLAYVCPGVAEPKVAVLSRDKFAAEITSAQSVRKVTPAELGTLDPATTNLLVLTGAEIPLDRADDVARFVERGGGLLIADTGWGWQQLNPDRSLVTDHGGNAVLRRAGLAFTTGMAGADQKGLIEVGPVDGLTHAQTALRALEDRQNAGAPAERKARRALCSSVVLSAAESAPADSAFSALLRQRLAEVRLDDRPTPTKPLDETRPFERVALLMQLKELEALPPEQVSAHPTADAFPGAVPADAPRVERVVTIEPGQKRWHSTGLYAAPGEKITVKVEGVERGKAPRVRIGAHTDDIRHLASWKRVPRISRSWPIRNGSQVVASPFGGAVYIETAAAVDLGSKLKVTISGAVEAPMFVLGKTTPQQWAAARSAPAPWAEFVVPGRVILTFRSDSIREMDDPTALMEHWKAVLDAMADFGGISRQRPFAERIVTDVQISAGYMHSGYPIMTHLDVSRDIVDLKALRTLKAGWGFYHELGHNHQQPEWTFEGTGEVTNNVFVHYVLETVCGLPVAEATNRALGPEMRQMIDAHLKQPDFDRWKREPFLALAMYAQVHTAFGWEPFKAVFAEYEALPSDQRPRTEQQKRDEWMVRLSRAVNRNLGPFFDAWGVPVSAEAKGKIADLPEWMPERVVPAKPGGKGP